jgi:hypothetical protein
MLPFENALILGGYTTDSIENDFSIIFNITRKCDGTAYFAEKSNLDAFVKTNEFEGHATYLKGDEQVLPFTKGYTVSSDSFAPDLFYHALQRLMASGIYHVWNRWNNHLSPKSPEIILKKIQKEEVQRKGPKPLNMKSNLKTIFLIFIFCVSASAVAFIGEQFAFCVNNQMSKIKVTAYKVYSRCVRLFELASEQL